MNKLNYNRFFHLHTVTGIVISVGLYIIFFAGAFTLLWDEIEAWEKADPIVETTTDDLGVLDLNLDLLLQDIERAGHSVSGRDFYFSKEKPNHFYISFYESNDSLETNGEEYKLIITHDPNTKIVSFKNQEDDDTYSMGYLFYRLHYFYQLGMPGYYLAGFVSFFFLFAIITGVIVHWKKIISNFYVFRPLAKLKTIWTDAHTVLGMIGLPFQFMYALTGAMFCLYLVIEPLENILPESVTDANTIEISQESFSYTAPKFADTTYVVTPFLDSLKMTWKEFQPRGISVDNYGKQNSTISIYGEVKKEKQFYHNANISYDFGTNKITSLADPNNLSYTKAIYEVAGNLHHADFGKIGTWPNYLLKIIYFIMALITCFVIITGVLIWLTARDKKNIPDKQRRFNEQVGFVYMALCLTMFPITALAFTVSKLIPESLNAERKLILYWVFFGGWLLASIFFWLKKNNYFTNKYTLLSGGVLSFCIPLVNGFSTGNWIWATFSTKNYDVFVFDLLWIFIGIITLYVVFRIKEKQSTIK